MLLHFEISNDSKSKFYEDSGNMLTSSVSERVHHHHHLLQIIKYKIATVIFTMFRKPNDMQKMYVQSAENGIQCTKYSHAWHNV